MGVKGLEPNGEHYNASSPTGVLEDHPLDVLQGLFDSKLKQHGFNLHDTAVFAATLEHLIHRESVELTQQAYEANNFTQSRLLTQEEVDTVLDTLMKLYIAGDKAASVPDSTFSQVYPSWKDTKVFLRDIRKNVVYAEGDQDHKNGRKPVFTLEFVTRIIEEVFEQYGVFQDSECKQMKGDLLKYGDRDTGLLRLSSFYQASLDHGTEQYDETQEYLRELGALDESDPTNPRVIVPNYITSKSNCIATSGLHAVCCINECEALMGHVERKIASPEAEPDRLAEVVADLGSSTVQAPRTLTAPLMYRLNEIAESHGGTVQLHGRLFAQWMHHAFPRECPFPHVSGTKNPQTPSEWMEENGGIPSVRTSSSEMQRLVAEAHAAAAGNFSDTSPMELMWHHKEELLAVHSARDSVGGIRGYLRRIVLLVASLAAFSVSMHMRSPYVSCPGQKWKLEKHLV